MNSVEDKKRVLGLGQMSERADRKKEKKERERRQKESKTHQPTIEAFPDVLVVPAQSTSQSKKSKRKGKERKKDFKVVSCLGET